MFNQTIASHSPYIGSGPYCYANSFAMMMGSGAPPTSVIEFATGSPFGMQLIGGRLPFFDPYGWNPESGFDGALTALGWTSTVTKGGSADDALNRLKTALLDGPVWVGPVEMGHLRHQPGMSEPIGADHYIVILDVNDERVLMHDPQGYPYASLPINGFMTAWRGETLTYGEPYTMRTGFSRITEISDEEAIIASIPAAIRWLSMEGSYNMPSGSLGNGEAAEGLAALIENDYGMELRDHLIHFAVRVGAHRLADASTCLARAGYSAAAQIADEQARLIGAIQYPLVIGDNTAAAALLSALAPKYDKLLAALENQI